MAKEIDNEEKNDFEKVNIENGRKKKKSLVGTILIAITIIFFTLVGTGLFMGLFSSIDKPIIYLYPTETTEVSVKLGNPEKLTCSYPKYKEEGWNVIAKPNGDLTDIETGRNLYSLYWEGKNENAKMNMKEGFVVKGEDTIKFLEEKLEILGLNEKEAEEFIIYWLPKLEKNKYNYIRFATKEEINQNMPLEINPKPDTIIRILMEFKGLDKYIEIPEQKLDTPIREGFVAVEWGGTELK